MKTRSWVGALALAISVFYSYSTQAQSGCSTPGCSVDSLNISTGYDHGAGSLYNPVTADGYWQLIQVPASSGITLPAPTWVINAYSSWDSFTGARWISAFQNPSYIVNNPSPQNPFTFQRCFCICEDTLVRIKFDFMVDDGGTVSLNGNPLTVANTGFHFLLPNKKSVDTTIALTAGQHCLTIDMRNLSSVAMGASLEGFIFGGSPLSQACCNPQGQICGTKFNDVNCDGTVVPTDPGLSGWTIELYDNMNNLITTATTDGTGAYCFDTLLPPGIYVVQEVNQTGWTQTFPAGGTHTINLNGGVQVANFGNCQEGGGDPCDFELGIKPFIDRCTVSFTAIHSVTPPAQIVSVLWTFGDGQSSTELDPTHFYDSPGVYTVCLRMVIFDGEKCCIKEVCREIEIRDECEKNCEIEADFAFELVNEACCEYEFVASILSTQTNILGYYWDFGDGTTGTGNPVRYVFPGAGGYQVCLTILAEGPKGECCWVTICQEIEIECEGQRGKRGTSHTLRVEGKETGDLTLYPNPAGDQVFLEFDLPKETPVSVTLYNMQGKVIFTKELGGVQEGPQQVTLETAELASGLYLCEVVTNSTTLRKQLVIRN